jgi:OOP family OmpA-OmpF porin
MKAKLYKISLCLAVSGLLLAPVYAQGIDRNVETPYGEPVVDPFDECVLSVGGEELTECAEALPVAEPPPVTPTRETVTLGADAYFDFDEATLRPEGENRLDSLAQDIQALGAGNVSEIEVVGHTDSIGTEEYNQGLSERRAQSVVDYLVLQGIDPNIISARGAGEANPIADNSTREGRAQNRRVDVTVEASEEIGN